MHDHKSQLISRSIRSRCSVPLFFRIYHQRILSSQRFRTQNVKPYCESSGITSKPVHLLTSLRLCTLQLRFTFFHKKKKILLELISFRLEYIDPHAITSDGSRKKKKNPIDIEKKEAILKYQIARHNGVLKPEFYKVVDVPLSRSLASEITAIRQIEKGRGEGCSCERDFRS